MLTSHRIALDPTNKQKTSLRQHAGYARFVWNWGVSECRRALDAGESSATYPQRFRPLFNAVKGELAPWSKGLSQNAAKYALIGLGDVWGQFLVGVGEIEEDGQEAEVSTTAFQEAQGGEADLSCG